MSMESDLFDAIKGLVSNRMYPDIAPADVAKPYIVYQQISGPSPIYVEKVVPNLKGARIQVNVWAETRLQANTLALQIESAITTATAFDGKPVGAFTALYEEDTGLRGTRQDFYIWSAR